MLDLRLSDMILVKSREASNRHESFYFVSIMRRYGHKNCYIFQYNVCEEKQEQNMDQEDMFDYKLDNSKIASFEEIHHLV